ncbi:transmembrane protein 94 [Helicoverpa armigera]|uniref:transmembrane protein 94 n=1 Tax=Helicoverpa armigera TaxID=29058 RepID=UPI00308294FE
MDDNNLHSLGYTTKTALLKLRDDIRNVIEEHRKKNPTGFGLVRNIISFSSEKVLLSGVAYTITLVYIVCLILTYLFGESVQAHAYLLWEAFFLFVILLVNFLVAFNEEYLYRNEIPHRIRKVLETLDEAIESSKWKENHYPHLCAPYSPCVILQWTYRDSTIVNLPWALLVEGDVIVLRPGQEVPGHCRGLQPEDPEQFFGQIFQPTTPQKDNFSTPRIRTPHRNKAYRMCETPYLKNLKLALEQATIRPVTVFEKQRYLCTVKIMEGIVLPLVISLVVIASFVRHVYHLPGITHWTEIYFLQTIAASLPLLQIVFPIAWVTLNCYGLARFKLLSETRQKYVRPKSCSISEDASDPLIQAMSESNLQPESLKSLGKTFFSILTGREDMVCRTANIVHVLGSLSALSCVDKKGILSWPNPTAEKVFFLRNSSPSSHNSSKTSLVGSMGHHSDEHVDTPIEGNKTVEPSTIVEVLDLTHDQNAPFCVEFDDQRWRQHLARLKPLGLAALLNTCAPAPRHTYAHFCAHLTCEAQYSEDLVPVTNRRCLCELAKQIGFTDAVTENYHVQECLAIFRQLQADTIRRETRFVRSLQLSTKVKVPLPHMLAVVVKDQANQLQMLTQGTADIILDSCVDYWNGRDLTPISPADRKKIIDFYQRNSLTAYCTAFAYKPLTRGISSSLSAMYLELPADSRQLYAPLSQHWADAPALHFHSTDSLLFNEVTDDDVKDAEGFFDMQCNQVFIGMVTMQYQAQSDMVELIERLERACIRFVHFSKENELRSRVFSEKMGLESGWNCHISLISEESASKSASPLSSQTLAQGKERGSRLNRHIDCDAAALGLYYSTNIATSKALSMSAPGAINLDHSTVKFDNEIKKARHSITTHTNLKFQRSSISTSHPSADSLLDEDEEGGSPADACRSLSCLTDSTDHSAPVNFDMSNRAKLPRGIENIRPHIEQVDNVPLLVSLFTDCTARSVQLMIQIMQDYGEVVCVMGSAANCLNMEIFMQADASIAVEPLYPVLCQKMPPYQVPESCIGPIDLARALNSVPCSLSMTRDADVSLFTLITMSRHYMTCLWNSTQFWICSVCFIALLQVGSLCAFVPLSLSVGGALWGGAVCVPALAAALAFAPLDPALMQRAATRPHLVLNAKMAVFVFWCYALKFLPAVLSILVLYAFTLRTFCEQLSQATNATACWIVYPINKGEFNVTHDLTLKSWHGWGDDFYDGFYLAQHITLALITSHLIVISLSFVHRQSSIWQKSFWANKVWSVTVVVLAVAQLCFSAIMLSSSYGFCAKWGVCGLRYFVPWPLGVGYSASLFLVFALNEFIKWQEIKADGRNQRRARLDFGTKLGMNSPF